MRNLAFMLTLIVSFIVVRSKAQDAPTQSTIAFARRMASTLAFERFTLSNGLRVILNRVPNSGAVGVAVDYAVGAVDEDEGETGYAHLLEHWLLEGSRNTGLFGGIQMAAERGGYANATTNRDRTIFFTIVPRMDLPFALWVEADRMRHPTLDATRFEVQREIVLDERRQNVDNHPFGRAMHDLSDHMFGLYPPYGHQVLGAEADILNATAQRVQSFHDRAYTPNNSVLVISGDFEMADAMNGIRAWFEPIPRGPAFTRAADPSTYQLRADEHGEVRAQDAHVRHSGFRMTWNVPGSRDADHLTLRVLAEVIERAMQRELRQAQHCETLYANLDGNARADTFNMVCNLTQQGDLERVRQVFTEHVARVREHAPTATELASAQRTVMRFSASMLVSTEARMTALADAETTRGSAEAVAADLIRVPQITAAEVQAAAATYLAPAPHTLVIEPAFAP